jgi:hypothetical protein
VDPDRTDFLKNFSFSDSAKPIAEFSLAVPNDTAIGYKQNIIKSGNSANRQARGMVAFIFDTVYCKKHEKDTVKSILLQFSPSDTAVSKYPDSLIIYDYDQFPLTNTDSLDPSKAIAKLNRVYDTTTKKWLFKGYLDSTSSDIASFSKSFRAVPRDTVFLRYLVINKKVYNDTLFRLNSEAKMTITFKRDTSFTETASSDYSNYCIFDKPPQADSLSMKPISSSETGRKAVFAFDMSKLWNSMNTSKGFNKIHSATLTIKDSIIPGFDTTKNIPFGYYISPTKFTDANELRDSIIKFGIFSEMGSKDSISLHATKFVRNFLSLKPTTVYLYIYNSKYLNKSSPDYNTARQETLWLKPSLTAIFTNNQ